MLVFPPSPYPPCPAILADRFNTLRYDPDQDAVILLNRAKYPLEREFVTCKTVEDVARAVETMIVQGGPPLAYAAGLGLALAERTEPAYRAAADRLLSTRPTADDLHHIIPAALERALAALDSGDDPKSAILDYVNGEIERGNRVSQACGQHAADLLADGDRVLTHCIAGAALCWMLWIAKQQGKTIHLIPTETRPYLQGARLTAQCAVELGIDWLMDFGFGIDQNDGFYFVTENANEIEINTTMTIAEYNMLRVEPNELNFGSIVDGVPPPINIVLNFC